LSGLQYLRFDLLHLRRTGMDAGANLMRVRFLTPPSVYRIVAVIRGNCHSSRPPLVRGPGIFFSHRFEFPLGDGRSKIRPRHKAYHVLAQPGWVGLLLRAFMACSAVNTCGGASWESAWQWKTGGHRFRRARKPPRGTPLLKPSLSSLGSAGLKSSTRGPAAPAHTELRKDDPIDAP